MDLLPYLLPTEGVYLWMELVESNVKIRCCVWSLKYGENDAVLQLLR